MASGSLTSRRDPNKDDVGPAKRSKKHLSNVLYSQDRERERVGFYRNALLRSWLNMIDAYRVINGVLRPSAALLYLRLTKLCDMLSRVACTTMTVAFVTEHNGTVFGPRYMTWSCFLLPWVDGICGCVRHLGHAPLDRVGRDNRTELKSHC